MKTSTFKLLFTWAMLAVSFSAFAADGIYKVYYLKGDNHFIREKSQRKLLKGDLLIDGDTIQTGKNGLVILGFGDGFKSRMKLTKNAELIIEGQRKEKDKGVNVSSTDLVLKLGNIVIEWANKDKVKKRMRVKTRHASMGIRGTRFFVNTGLSGRTVLAVYDGVVLGKHNDSSTGIPLTSKEGMVFTDGGMQKKVDNPKWFGKINWKVDGKSKKDIFRHSKIKDALDSYFKSEKSTYKRNKVKDIEYSSNEKLLKEQCNNSKARSCTALAIKLLKKTGDYESDIIRGFLNKGCKLKDTKACVWTGRIEYEFGTKSTGRKYINDLCIAGDSYACFSRWEIATKENDANANRFFKKSVEISKGLKNFDESMNSFQAACDLENPVACANLGVLLESINRSPESRQFYKKACDLGDGVGCSNLGFFKQEDGNMTEARELYQKACYTDIAEGCYNLSCIHSKNNKISLSSQYLKMAIIGGYRDWGQIESDSDLVNLRKTPEYKVVLDEFKK